MSPIREVTGAVHGGERDHLELLGHALGDLPQPLERGGVRGVVEVVDRLAAVVVAHRPDEQVQPTGGGVLDGGQHLGRVQRGLAQVQQPYDGQLGAVSSHRRAYDARSTGGRTPHWAVGR